MILDEIITEFKKFHESVYVGYAPTSETEIERLEHQLQQKLPEDFKDFLLISNGAIINCCELYGIKAGIRAEDLYDNYIFETKAAGNPMPEYCLPIYPDGFGSHNCLDLKSMSPDGESCNVIFWQHDYLYDEPPEPDIDANSFTEFLEIELKQMLEWYNYDGSDKEVKDK